ncbi:HAD family hydrolase [Amycolatopsis albispora]|uniref:Haloacid dehalogenase n=1 Tax=Amycolatopsis albispora TaxID=1804986 RepID=A0A344L8W7_9PSEU|nr:HAD family hydrolase [Amycolatopsis albispora]AXB44491.1 haloacid dehalogenase [Amycolatopsis albispora]
MLCVFDVNETLLDLAPLDEVFGSADARRAWFARVIHTALTVTATGGYRDFAAIAGAAADERHRAELGPVLRSLPAHPDVPSGLARLRDAGFTLVALGNSPLSVVETQLRNAGIRDHFDAVFSAEQAGALKPAAAPYRRVLDAYPGEDAMMIAAHGWDIAGAHAVGLRTAFIERPGQAQLPGGPEADLAAPDIDALATKLIEAGS